MKIVIPYLFEAFPATDDLLLFEGLKNLFKDHDVSFWDLNQGASPDKDSLHILSGEMSQFAAMIQKILANPVSSLLCLSVKMNDSEVNGLTTPVRNCLTEIAKKGSLSAYDSDSKLHLESVLNQTLPPATGSILFFNSFTKIAYSEPKSVFCFDRNTEENLLKSVFENLQKNDSSLFIPNQSKDLEMLPPYGLNTLVCQHFATTYTAALASASEIFSTREAPAVIGAALGIPTRYYSHQKSSLLEEIEVPQNSAFVENRPPLANSEILKMYQNRLREYLEKFSVSMSGKASPSLLSDSRFSLASISDRNYYPFLKGWIQNCLQFVQAPIFHILALDTDVKNFLKRDFPEVEIHAHLLEDLWSAAELPEILSRSIGIRAFSTKPHLIKKALLTSNRPVVYTDSDVYFFSSPENLLNSIGDSSLLLFPHWNDDKPASRRDGLFNAGMIVASQGSLEFLDWWIHSCFQDCRIAPDEGATGDQGYLDFAPVHFKNVKVYSHGDQNVARWNLKTLGVQLKPGFVPTIANGKSVQTFHAAFIDGIGMFECKAAWDQICTFFSANLKTAKNAAFVPNTLIQQSRHWVGLSRVLLLQKSLLRAKGISSQDSVRDILMSPRLQRVLNALFSLKNRNAVCESEFSRKTVEADNDWTRSQKNLLLEKSEGNTLTLKRVA